MIFTIRKITQKQSNKLLKAFYFLDKYYIPGIAWGVFIIYLSLAPASSFHNFNFNFIIPSDKIVHFFLYFSWYSIILHHFSVKRKAGILPFNFILKLAAFLCSFGILMEILQLTLTSDRFFSFTDILANTIGIASSILIYRFFLYRFRWF